MPPSKRIAPTLGPVPAPSSPSQALPLQVPLPADAPAPESRVEPAALVSDAEPSAKSAADPSGDRAVEPGAEPSVTQRRLEAVTRFLDRYPWLLPTISFGIGWLSFFLFQRGENLARAIAVIALIGWPWLFAENLVGRWIVQRSRGRLSAGSVHFVTQQIQQEILFFALPFLFGAMVWVPGQMLFMAVAVAIAIVISIDPIYFRRIASHAGWSSALHAYCTFVSALVVLPVALHLPLDRALPFALGITALSLLLSLPRMLRAAPTAQLRLLGCAALVACFPVIWALRSWIPPAGLWVRQARITDRIDQLDPGPRLKSLSTEALHGAGLIAFVAVRAPTGLSQAVVFDWHHGGERIDRIPAEISGGREDGFRTYSRKQNFPEASSGRWRVDLRTPEGQLIARMRFTVE